MRVLVAPDPGDGVSALAAPPQKHIPSCGELLGFNNSLQSPEDPQQRGARCWWPPREPRAAVEKGKAASCVSLVRDWQALPSSPEHR